MKGINVSILCLGFVICASSCNGGATRQQAAENYPLLILQPEDRQLSVKYSAVVEGRQDVEVRPQVSGTITQVCVYEGAHVRKGQVLFVINPGRRLMSGGQANIVIPYDRRQSIVIPQGATYEIQNRVFAYKIVNGRTASTPIAVFGVDDGKEYIVEEGLAAGGTIVAEGAGLLRSGIAVAPAPAAPANGEEE